MGAPGVAVPQRNQSSSYYPNVVVDQTPGGGVEIPPTANIGVAGDDGQRRTMLGAAPEGVQ